MKLEEMRYYVEIVDAGSINQASKTLYVAQPALSRTIASLERELGFTLLERSKHGVVPTTEGKQVYDDCIHMLGLYAECERHWEDLAYQNKEKDEPVTISIFALPMICNSTMNKVIYEVTKNYPRVRLRLFERQLGDILETMAAQSQAIALSHYNEKTKADIYNFAKAHNLQILPLFDDEYRFFTSCDDPLVKQDSISESNLQDYTLVDYADEQTESNPRFADAGLTGLFNMFGESFYLSNRYDMMSFAANSPQVVALSAVRMTRDNPFRENDRLKILPLSSFRVPMTYFILYAKDAGIEEKITVGTLHSFYESLGNLPLDD